MRDPLTESELDDEFRMIAEALVAEAPPPAAHLPVADDAVVLGLVARPRRRARRRLTIAVAGAAAVVAVAVGIEWPDPHDEPDVEVGTVVASDGSGPQRLILESWPGEVLDDSTPVPLPLGGLRPSRLRGVHGLADGRSVLVDVRDAGTYLVVVGADGGLETERRVGERRADVALLTATPEEAILVRRPGGAYPGPWRIVAHDLETGEEQELARTGSIVRDADVTGDALIFGPDTPGCSLQIVDLVTRHRQTMSIADCHGGVKTVRVAPDGDHAAVVYTTGSAELRLAIVDLVRMNVFVQEDLGGHDGFCTGGPCPPGVRPLSYAGIAWDGNTVKVALVQLDKDPNWPFGESGLQPEALVIHSREARE